jgi:hypothetical protein
MVDNFVTTTRVPCLTRIVPLSPLIAEVTNPCVTTMTAEIASEPDMAAPVRSAAVSGDAAIGGHSVSQRS